MKKAIKKLELNLILQSVAEYASSFVAKNSIIGIQPNNNIDDVRQLLEKTAQANICISKLLIHPNFTFDCINGALEKARVFSTLLPADLLRIMRLLSVSRLVKSQLSQPVEENISLLSGIASTIFIDKNLEDEIDKCVENETMLSDKASSKLYSIRSAIRKANDDVKTKLQSFIKSAEYKQFLQDSFITVREGRYVIPVKNEYRANISGLIHDVSGSKSTVFIEPMPIVELNNKIKMLTIDETQEIERILIEFTKKIAGIAIELEINENAVTDLDIIFAKALYSIANKAEKPKVNAKGYVRLKKARHPLLNKTSVVPVSIEFGNKNNLLVITGPNTGGKTVSLKTVGLFTLMAWCGLFLPCEEGEISVYDGIFCDIGDEQSIEQNLSTFSGHITNIASILNEAGKNSLVLFDELGAGTEPNEGAALALSITEFLLNKKIKGVITTHYSELKEFALVNDGIENASMEFDLKTLMPTYKLIVGVPGSSNAIEIARRLGLPSEITSNAKLKLSDDKIEFENILKGAEQLRQKYENTGEEIETLKRDLEAQKSIALKQNELLSMERDDLLKNSKTAAKRIITDAELEASELIKELKGLIDRYNLSETELFEARSKLKKLKNKKFFVDEETEIEELRPVDIKTLKVSDEVYVKALNSKGIVISQINSKGEVEILVGKIKLFAAENDLAQSNIPIKKINKNTDTIKLNLSENTKQFFPELMLLGKTREEALNELEVFIDRAVVSGVGEVRIVHGMGTGTLKKAVHDFLRNSITVDEFRLGGQGEGGSGVTIAKFK